MGIDEQEKTKELVEELSANMQAASLRSCAATGSADPAIICSQCGKQITSGQVLVIGDDIMGTPFCCSIQCANEYNPDTLTRAKLDSLFGRWRKTTPPNS